MVHLSIVAVLAVLISLAAANGNGQSSVMRKQDTHGNYQFGYKIHDPWGASNYREERGHPNGKHNAVVGSYGLKDADGRMRVVEYVADGAGFRAKIRTNEPGAGNADTGDAIYNGQDPSGAADITFASGGKNSHEPQQYHGYKGKGYSHQGGYLNDGPIDGGFAGPIGGPFL